MPVQLIESLQEFAYAHFPTKHETYDDFPFSGLSLKSSATGGYIPANFVQLTRFMSYSLVDKIWWNFPGPYHDLIRRPAEDEHWKWARMVRKARQKRQIYVRCVAVRTDDGNVQGAAIYHRGGVSSEGERGAYLQYLAVAPRCRRRFAETPLFSGVGEGILTLVMAHSLEWGYRGRVILDAMPGAVNFYKKYDFVETEPFGGRMMSGTTHIELTPHAAERQLEEVGVI